MSSSRSVCSHLHSIAHGDALTRGGLTKTDGAASRPASFISSTPHGIATSTDAALPCSAFTFHCQCGDSFLAGPDSTYDLRAADGQLVALYTEEACLSLIWTGVDLVPRHIDPDRHPVFFNSCVAASSASETPVPNRQQAAKTRARILFIQ